MPTKEWVQTREQSFNSVELVGFRGAGFLRLVDMLGVKFPETIPETVEADIEIRDFYYQWL